MRPFLQLGRVKKGVRMFDLLFFIKSYCHLLRIGSKTTQLKVRLFKDFFRNGLTSKPEDHFLK